MAWLLPAAAVAAPFVLPLLPSGPLERTAFHNASFWSWGGGVLAVPPAVDPQWPYHLFASGFTNGCGLNGWTTNSEAIHAVATDPMGPFQLVDVSLPVYQHNVSPMLVNESGRLTFLLWTIGMSPEGRVANCTRLDQAHTAPPPPLQHGAELCELHQSASPYGPWTAVRNASGGLNLLPGGVTNPVGYYNDSTSTMYVVGHNSHNVTLNVAKDWRSGDFGSPQSLFPVVTDGWCAEDPFLWWDAEDGSGSDHAGVWKILFHQYNCSDPHHQQRVGGFAQSTSSDILGGWAVQSNEVPAYSTTVDMDDGSVLTLSRRERPHVYFERTASGRAYPAVLLTGVCPMPTGNTSCFTLSQGIAAPQDLNE